MSDYRQGLLTMRVVFNYATKTNMNYAQCDLNQSPPNMSDYMMLLS